MTRRKGNDKHKTRDDFEDISDADLREGHEMLHPPDEGRGLPRLGHGGSLELAVREYLGL